METCLDVNCACKNYEPEYDKKFNQAFLSRKMTKAYASNSLGNKNPNAELKRLPFKINYKTKVEIFKKQIEDKIELFLGEYPKSEGIQLLKSYFNHKFCDSSYKALFVQLENSISCKSFTGKVFIYHLKTQI
jgi:hypothetical protein